jgi:hypothetical protein
MFSYEEVFGNKNKVLFVMAHPDDILLYYAALVNKMMALLIFGVKPKSSAVINAFI